MNENGIAQPITHAVNQHLAAIDHKLELIFVVLEPHIPAFDSRIGKSVELCDVIDSEEIAPTNLDHLPPNGRSEGIGKSHRKNGADDQETLGNHSDENPTKSGVIRGEISICEAITGPF